MLIFRCNAGVNVAHATIGTPPERTSNILFGSLSL